MTYAFMKDWEEKAQKRRKSWATIFPRIQFMEPEEAAASRTALLEYCKLDTWAMVKVWEKLKKVTE